MADTIELPPRDEPLAAPQRIAYVLKRYPRFSETFVVNEILAHEQAGLELDIFALRPPTDAHFQDKLSAVRAGVTYLPDGACRAGDFWAALQTAARSGPRGAQLLGEFADVAAADAYQAMHLARLVHDRGIDHLHAHFATSATAVARMAAALSGVTYSFTAHAKDIFHDDVDADELRRKIASASRVVTVSDFNLRHLRGEFPSLAPRIVRIYNGLDLAEFDYCPPADRLPKIVAVGRLVEKKGFGDLIEACAALAARGVDFECDIIGEGEELPRLARKIAQLEISRRVRLVGAKPRAEVLKAMRSAAVLAAPCLVGDDGNRDGLPTVLLEAMALGTPCASTPVTGIPEVILHEQTGLLVAERSPLELAATLRRFLGDASLRQRLAGKARALIEAKFDVHRNAAQQRRCFATDQYADAEFAGASAEAR